MYHLVRGFSLRHGLFTRSEGVLRCRHTRRLVLNRRLASRNSRRSNSSILHMTQRA
jgi:hypothetical protein